MTSRLRASDIYAIDHVTASRASASVLVCDSSCDHVSTQFIVSLMRVFVG